MTKTIKPLLISLLNGSKKNHKRDRLRVELINALSVEELQHIDDQLVAFLRIELDKMVMDKLISDTYVGLSGNNQTATDGS